MRRIRLTKISDDAFNGNHPNGINEGFSIEGEIENLPKKGERFYPEQRKKMDLYSRGFSTSIVTEELNENNIFKTMYSTYKIEYLDNESS